MTIHPFTRNVLMLDAVVSAAAGIVMAAGAGVLAPLLALPQPLLLWAGLALFPWVAVLVAVARRERISRAVLIDVIAVNALWVAASFGILVSGMVAPNLLGTLFVVAQALAVGLFAALQWTALRRAWPAAQG